ncbi:hypothetical protein DTW90_15660 [Neorhizobium sp. P12A]|uniref:hypothetical protein n=1 Tax=Rhizobium/Agrobacterium group TaxID=227290 RepID=UPI001050B903|nr:MULTISPECIES: hypothetical protein [Rhizobium/Agrobacterium group]KAA0698297.1 hypothetical protein DTW90_15660 [Neorhizobium sp. P12A]TCR92938.1 hypothetical protein EV561_101383 [Rhizobium sp. BK376]
MLKVGQCAVLVGSSVRTFSDQIQLLPDYNYLWKDALLGVLENIGPGEYIYGSEWSTEIARDQDLACIDGLKIKNVRPVYLEVVEFETWPDWSSYWKSISSNARRNFNKINNTQEAERLKIYEAINGLKYTLALFRLKNATFLRKKIGNIIPLTLLRHVLRYAVLRKHIRSVVCRKDETVLGFATCVDVGRHIFYLEGGAEHAVAGVGWYTLLSAIRCAFDRTGGRGAFVMGPVDDETLTQPEWSGLARSRLSCRATRRRQATINFQWG